MCLLNYTYFLALASTQTEESDRPIKLAFATRLPYLLKSLYYQSSQQNIKNLYGTSCNTNENNSQYSPSNVLTEGCANFEKSSSYLKILGVRKVTRRKIHIVKPQKLGVTVRNLVVRVIRRPGLVNLCIYVPCMTLKVSRDCLPMQHKSIQMYKRVFVRYELVFFWKTMTRNSCFKNLNEMAYDAKFLQAVN